MRLIDFRGGKTRDERNKERMGVRAPGFPAPKRDSEGKSIAPEGLFLPGLQ